jgi:hypothetical protein
MTIVRPALIALGLSLALGAAAQAADVGAPVAATPINGLVNSGQIKPTLDLANHRLFIPASYDAGPARDPRFAVTAVDRQVGPNAKASLGYLCGLEPGPNEISGVVSSHEPVGTFLGAQFSLAFK